MHVQKELVALDGDELQEVFKLLQVPVRHAELASEIGAVIWIDLGQGKRVVVLGLVVSMVLLV